MNNGEQLNEFGFRQKDMDYMIRLFMEHPEIEKVLIYGSRARGDFEHGSDVDFALEGKEITSDIVLLIHTKLEEESPTYLWFDVTHIDTLKNQKLLEQIEKDGKLLFIKA